MKDLKQLPEGDLRVRYFAAEAMYQEAQTRQGLDLTSEVGPHEDYFLFRDEMISRGLLDTM